MLARHSHGFILFLFLKHSEHSVSVSPFSSELAFVSCMTSCLCLSRANSGLVGIFSALLVYKSLDFSLSLYFASAALFSLNSYCGYVLVLGPSRWVPSFLCNHGPVRGCQPILSPFSPTDIFFRFRITYSMQMSVPLAGRLSLLFLSCCKKRLQTPMPISAEFL